MAREEQRHAVSAGDRCNQGDRGSHSIVSGDEEDACPVGLGDATIHRDGTACWDRPELVIRHELELEELTLLACETGRGLAPEESRVSPALLELEERLAWEIGGTPVEDMP